MTKSADSARVESIPRAPRFVPARGTPRSRRGRWRALVLILVHVGFVLHIAHWRVAGETMTPLEPSESMWTLELGYVNAGFLVFATSILLTAVFGRFFCGWLCHFVAYQDLCAWLLGKLGLRPRPVRSRLLVFVPFGIAFYMFVWPSLRRAFAGAPSPDWQWELSTTRFWETFPGPGIAILTVVVCGFLLVWWLGAKGFCTYGCPYGVFFGVADRSAIGRIRVTDACEGCGHCTAVCTSNVRVHEEVARHRMVVDPGCMKCMDCVSACPKDALYYGFGKPTGFARGAVAKRRRPPADFTLGEEVAMALVFVFALWSFRSLYNLVPLLLAAGLGVIAAIAAVVAWRLLRGRALRFQSTALRSDGRATVKGRIVFVACLGFLALMLHSAFVRQATTKGERLAFASADPSLAPAKRRAHLEAAQELLLRAESFGLLGDSALQKTLGFVERDLGDLPQAERRLRRAQALHPDAHWPAASIPLAHVIARQGRPEEAEAILAGVAAEHPEIVDAPLLLAVSLGARGEKDAARRVLQDLLARYPNDPRARALERQLAEPR